MLLLEAVVSSAESYPQVTVNNIQTNTPSEPYYVNLCNHMVGHAECFTVSHHQAPTRRWMVETTGVARTFSAPGVRLGAVEAPKLPDFLKENGEARGSREGTGTTGEIQRT